MKNSKVMVVAALLLPIFLFVNLDNNELWAAVPQTSDIVGQVSDVASQGGSSNGGASDVPISRPGRPDLIETLIFADDFNILVSALRSADLVRFLKGPGPYTLLAPTDEAFALINPEVLRDLLDPRNVDLLVDLLQLHVVNREIFSSNFSQQTTRVEALNGEALDFVPRRETIFVNNAQIIRADIVASNGVVHVVDQVVRPDMVFETSDSGQSILELASRTKRLNTLILAIRAHGLDDILSREGPFTIFAPSDEAFAQLPLTLEHIDFHALLTYHVVADKLMADDLANRSFARTLNGEAVSFGTSRFGDPMVNDAEFIAVDLEGSNGVIHIIDRILWPDEF